MSPLSIKMLKNGNNAKDSNYSCVCEINNLAEFIHDAKTYNQPVLPGK